MGEGSRPTFVYQFYYMTWMLTIRQLIIHLLKKHFSIIFNHWNTFFGVILVQHRNVHSLKKLELLSENILILAVFIYAQSLQVFTLTIL